MKSLSKHVNENLQIDEGKENTITIVFLNEDEYKSFKDDTSTHYGQQYKTVVLSDIGKKKYDNSTDGWFIHVDVNALSKQHGKNISSSMKNKYPSVMFT